MWLLWMVERWREDQVTLQEKLQHGGYIRPTSPRLHQAEDYTDTSFTAVRGVRLLVLIHKIYHRTSIKLRTLNGFNCFIAD